VTKHSAGEPSSAPPPGARETEVEQPVAEPQQQLDDDVVTDDGPTGPTGPEDDLGEVDPFLEEDVVVDPSDLESPGEPEAVLAEAQQGLAERTADLQRLQAEYVNYKRRVERDRELVRENATYTALAPIVEVLDTIDRAREHGDLDQGLQAVADQLERVVANAGLVKYGEPGEAFDPRLHEALSHIGEDPEVKVTTCKVIAKAGYRIGDRVVRAAQVLVVDPAGA
jgi:molecular chaperone GrpE